MGNVISSGVSYCTSFLVGHAKYILVLEDNLEALQSNVQLLEARKTDLENKIKIEERKGLQRLQEVLVWLLRVEVVQSQVRDLLDARTTEVERLSMCGYCSNDFILTYRYGKKVSENLEKMKGFLSSKSFDVVAMECLPPDMEEGSPQSSSLSSSMEEGPSQSPTGLPPDMEEDTYQSTTGIPTDIDESFQSTTGLLSNMEEGSPQSTTGMPLDMDENSLSTTGMFSNIEKDSYQFTAGLPPNIEEGLSQSTIGMPRDMDEGPSQSTISLPFPPNIKERSSPISFPPDKKEDSYEATIVLLLNITEGLSQSTTGMPSNMEEDPYQLTTSLPPYVEEEPFQPTNDMALNIEEGASQRTIGLSHNMEVGISQSTIGLPLDMEEGSSQSTIFLPLPPNMEKEPSQSTISLILSPNIEEGSSQSTTDLTPDMEEDPCQSTTGLPSDIEEENMLEAIWKRVMEDKVGILGLYGISGIGKTTLLKDIEKKFLERRDEFDEIISVKVCQDLQIGRIQKQIGKRLGLSNIDWEQKTKDEKASDINKVLLTKKRFVMLLDDIWGKVELEEIGIPLPSTQNRSKVVYTTRSRKVCEHMGPDDMEVKRIDPENAWKLFQQKVKASTLASDPRIPELARKVCEKCKGLPLALNVIGETMASKMTVHEWQRAIEVLNSNSAKYTIEVEDEIFKVLKLSYDYLDDERVQQCFQYCALFPEDDSIDKDRLVEYWISEGFINEGRKNEEAMNQGYAIIDILVDACLLINLESIMKVKMHDVVRQMALWIGSNFGKEQDNFIVRTGAGLHEMPEVRNWNVVRRMSLENNEIETISITPDCPNLTTLFLQQNKLANISGECFMSMPKLVIMDLSWNKQLTKLPEEVSKLVSLQYLGLAGTTLEELPMGLKELIQLRHLHLDYMEKLQSISVISRLSNLETLNVFDSIPLSLALIKDIELLKNLKFLSVTILELSILECFMSIPRLASCTQDLSLDLGEFEAENVSLVAIAASLRTLKMRKGSISYLMEETRYEFSYLMEDARYGCRSPSTVSFQNLYSIALVGVRGIQDLTWLLFAPSLTFVSLNGLSEVCEIISREKVSRIINEGSSIIPFQKLHTLELNDMEELTSIYWEALVFPNLTTIKINMCPKLKKLPLNKESSKGNHLQLQSKDKKWLDGIEWEDVEIKDRLLHQYQVAPPTSTLQRCSIM